MPEFTNPTFNPNASKKTNSGDEGELYLDPTKLNRPINKPVEDLYLESTELKIPRSYTADKDFIHEVTFTSNFTLSKFINAGILLVFIICFCLLIYGILARPLGEYDTFNEESANVRGYPPKHKPSKKELLRRKQEMWDRLPFYKYFFANYRTRPTKFCRPNFNNYTASYNWLYQFAYRDF